MQTINHNQTQVTIEESSGQIVSWSSKGVDFLYQGSSLRRSGIPILFPYANPLEKGLLKYSGKPMGQHGFGRDVGWEYEQISQNQGLLVLRSNNLPEEIKAAYPFTYEAIIIVSIKEGETGSKLTYKLEVANTGSQDLPIAPGIHPYFPLLHKLKSTLKVVQNDQVLDFTSLDWEEEMEGNFFSFTTTHVEFEKFDLTISSPNTDIDHLVAWSQPPNKEDYDFVCLEPFTRATNGINKNPIIIPPQQTWSGIFVFEVNMH